MALTLWRLEPEGPRRVGLDQLPLVVEEECNAWLDLRIEDLPELAEVRKHLPGHPLNWEDAANPAHRPKLEDHGDHLFLVMHSLNVSAERLAQQLETIQMAAFLSSFILITITSGPMHAAEEVHKRLERGAALLAQGPDAVLHAIVDSLVDDYTPHVVRWEEEVERLDKEALTNPKRQVLARILAIRKLLVKLRRLAMGQREILAQLTRERSDLIRASRRMYFQDVYDHLQSLVESSDNLREVLSMAVDIYLNSVNNRLNEVMKMLTVISAVLLPLNLITGFFGMNFEHLPGLHHPNAFALIMAGMLGVAALMLGLFRLYKWL